MLELRPSVVWVEGSRDNGCRPGGTCGRQRGWASMCGLGGWQSRHLGQREWSEPAVSRGVLEQGGLSHFHGLCFHS